MFTFDDYLQEELKKEQEALASDLDSILMEEMRYLLEYQDEDMDYLVASGEHCTNLADHDPYVDNYYYYKYG